MINPNLYQYRNLLFQLVFFGHGNQICALDECTFMVQ